MSVLSQPRWPHQQHAYDETNAALAAGVRRLVVTSPTGGGKTRMQFDQIERVLSDWGGVLLLSNRRMLLSQHARNAKAAGFSFGFRAANYRDLVSAAGMEIGFHHGERMADRSLQLAMTQTECNRVLVKGEPLHACKLVLVDEAHLHCAPRIVELCDRYQEAGADIVGYTATPVDLAAMNYERLIVAGTTSELRGCNALVPAITYAPDEPNLKDVEPSAATGEFTEQQIVDAMFGGKVQTKKKPPIIGRVLEKWREYNPDALPTLLFAPSVAASLWFAEAFQAAGYRAAHVDGESIWLDGQLHPTNKPGLREELARQHKDGELAVVCNRFVLREGIDWPWVRCGIFATMFGGVSSFLQSGGRLLRKTHGKDEVIVIDHGGNWWRHGSLNSDRQWIANETNYQASQRRLDAFRNPVEGEPKPREPVVCPNCGRVRPDSDKYGMQCPYCNYLASHKSRTVLSADGTLKEMKGDIIKERKVKLHADTADIWKQCYHRCKNAKKPLTFKQAMGLFFRENFYWPPRDLPFMPKRETDWARKIKDVSSPDLIGFGERKNE